MPTPNSSVVRTLQICAALADEQPAGVRELARITGQPRSTVQRALESLEAAGWATREEGRWSLTLVPTAIGLKAGSVGNLREAARPAMLRLLEHSDESVRLWVPDQRRAVLIESYDGRRPVRYVSPPLGESLPLHAGAGGKAILAALLVDDVEAYLVGALERLTGQTLTEPKRLRADLKLTRERGFAVTDGEARDDIGGVAAAVTDPTGRPVAALSLALPMHRVTPELVSEYGAHVMAEAAALTRQLGG
ncbi:MAG TPA: IclR family transcriptional regulator [Frankiaceae bacterium]|nr:IclR family transcriptional regulator [Frankiaceae bacterium]